MTSFRSGFRQSLIDAELGNIIIRADDSLQAAAVDVQPFFTCKQVCSLSRFVEAMASISMSGAILFSSVMTE